ncbi:DNA polymerase III subunit epsilon [Methylobacterium nodulans]|uniref:DNA polymerase III subunit epsilon n=1 Tax=Methylobacterium nodulans (strain LMG 21967 / CNCM I-2342 / ORS 2060) TaxID=460265 RepID=B8IKS2_METNO|nr:DNA polymerase III subunit epsilon [Methylobacterium nodulans]ACL56279.1 DNA polymerase III, epsilon subunit [Methylobacterium nodulans ORS 2060]
MLREIVLDTETTGTDAKTDRLIEIGGIELLNHIPTGREFHRYINPQRAVSQGAFAVHGLSDAFLADKPLFAEILPDFLDFCGDATFVIHNAAFDVGFLNAEYARLGETAPPPIELSAVVDTLALARRKHPNAANNLDALCARYGIDNSRRTKHGALLDAQILAEVYIELLGGKQTSLGLTLEAASIVRVTQEAGPVAHGPRSVRSRLTDAERTAHAAFTASLGANAVWRDYIGEETAG